MKHKIKKTIAVFFGAKSPEHDVSVITGLQVIKAIDLTQFDVFPVYIAPNGDWLVGKELLDTNNYIFSKEYQNKLDIVTLDLGNNLDNKGRLLLKKANFFSKKVIEFDIAILALHGINSEDGKFAAIMEIANVPYTGMRHFASAILMNKAVTNNLCNHIGIPVLPQKLIHRPKNGFIIDPKELREMVNELVFPLCVKPCNLGSSIGVAKVNNFEELSATLPTIFKYDNISIVEPYVENLVEYNISVGFIKNILVTSAIEQPKCTTELLDFKQKYACNNNNNHNKLSGQNNIPSSGMLSMTRTLNPKLKSDLEEKIRNWAKLAFNAVNGSGYPRIDFLHNSKTGETWLNEVNPTPGSFGFYLWEASEYKILFTELLNFLILEAEELHKKQQLPLDPTPIEARLFPRKT